MKRVLHVLESLNRNGTETFIMNVFRKIDRKQFMFDFLVFKENQNGFEKEFRDMGASIFLLPHRKNGISNYLKSLNKFFKENQGKYDTIHMHGLSFTTIAPLRYSKKYGIPTRIFHLHSNNCTGFHNKILHNINRFRISSYATLLLGCGKTTLEWGKPFIRKNLICDIIPNGIDLNRFKFLPELRNRLRSELGISPSTIIIGHIGQFIIAKNHSFLIDLMEKMTNEGLDIKLFCVGDGPLLCDIKKLVRNKGLENKVIFPGRTAEPEKYFQIFDIMVMPSLHEGLPFVLLEAQASLLPVIVSSNIPAETKLSDKFQFLSLNEPLNKWIDTIIESAKLPRQKTEPTDFLNSFSIENTVKKLCKIYS